MVSKYWQERSEAEIRAKIKRGKTLEQEMEDLYAHHYKAIESDLEAFLNRYAEHNRIDIVEARKRVDDFDVRAFAFKAKRYVEEKDFSARANAELRLYNLKMRVKSHELLQYKLDLEMLALSEGERQLSERFMTETYVQEMQRQAGLLGHSVADVKRIEQLAQASLNANFYGAKWSDKIWKRQQVLRQILQRDIEGMLFRGHHPTKIISRLRREFDTSVYEAKRLAVTEMARMSIEAQRQAFSDYGYKKYEFIAEPSACPYCAKLDGKVFDVAEMRIGENAPPMHPHCHCTTGAMGDDSKEQQDWSYEHMEDITDSYVTGKNHVPSIDIKNEVTKNGVTYVVDGHNVVSDHSNYEHKVASWFSSITGRHVDILPRVNYPKNINTPDYLVDGLPFDLKEITGSGKSVIDGNLRKAKKQAPNIIFDITKSPLSSSEIMEQLNQIYKVGRRGLGTTIVKQRNEVIAVLRPRM